MGCSTLTDPSIPFWDLYCPMGAGFNELLIWQDDAGDPINMVDYTAMMQVRQTADDPDYIISISTQNGGITLGATNGNVNLIIANTVTQTLPPGVYAYDIKFYPPSDPEFFWLRGNFIIPATVTRP